MAKLMSKIVCSSRYSQSTVRYALNDCARYLLVICAISKLVMSATAPLQIIRAQNIYKNVKDVPNENAKRKIVLGLRHTKAPISKENSAILPNLPASSPVVVLLTSKKWTDGPSRFICNERKTVLAQLDKDRPIIGSICLEALVTSKRLEEVDKIQRRNILVSSCYEDYEIVIKEA